MREAGIEESESLIASTSNDETNLLICKTAKSLFSCRVITRVIKDEYTDLYKDIGTDVVVSDISATVGLLEKAAASNGLYGMITMGGKEGDVIEVDVADGSTADGSSIEDLDFPDLCTVGLIMRDSNLIPPRGNTVFEKGDQVVPVGKSEELISSIELFRTE